MSDMRLVELHTRMEFLEICCKTLNAEWKRSYTARSHSLSKSSSNLPVALVLITDSIPAIFVGHARICRVIEDADACFIESVIIVPERRGEGLGRVLMNLIEEYARSKGFKRAHLSTLDKKDFYEKLGYVTSKPVCAIGSSRFNFKILPFVRMTSVVKENETTNNRTNSVSVADAGNNNKNLKNGACLNSIPPPPPPPPPPMPVQPHVTSRNPRSKIDDGDSDNDADAAEKSKNTGHTCCVI